MEGEPYIVARCMNLKNVGILEIFYYISGSWIF